MLFEKKKEKAARAAVLRQRMDAILDGLPSPAGIALSPDGARLRAILRRSPFLCLELETPHPARICLARILTPTKEEVVRLPEFPEEGEEEQERLRALLRRYLSIESDAPTPASAEHTYHLKLSVLGDFTYLPKWEELGHTDVQIGGESDPDAPDPADP